MLEPLWLVPGDEGDGAVDAGAAVWANAAPDKLKAAATARIVVFISTSWVVSISETQPVPHDEVPRPADIAWAFPRDRGGFDG